MKAMIQSVTDNWVPGLFLLLMLGSLWAIGRLYFTL